MKRKYAALVLGLALSVTSINVFAAETELTQTEAAEATESDGTVEIPEGTETDTEEDPEAGISDVSTVVWGEVTATEEGSITINVAELQGTDTEADGTKTDNTAADSTEETSAETDTEAEDAAGTEDAAVADTAMSGADNYAELFTYSGEEQTINLTEETVVQLIYQDADAEKMQKLTEEYSDKEAAAEMNEAEEAVTDSAADDSEADDTTEEAAEADDAATEENAEDGDAATEEAAEADDAETGEADEPIVAELSIDAILEGDLVYAAVDEDGNAVTVLVFMPETSVETGEVFDEESEAPADDTLAEDAEETDAEVSE